MTYLNLDNIKKHLNIDSDFTDDDTYITSLGNVAEAMVAKDLNDDLSEIADNGDLPAPIVHACYLLIGNLYMNRESVAFAQSHEIPLSFRYLLSPYHNYSSSTL